MKTTTTTMIINNLAEGTSSRAGIKTKGSIILDIHLIFRHHSLIKRLDPNLQRLKVVLSKIQENLH